MNFLSFFKKKTAGEVELEKRLEELREEKKRMEKEISETRERKHSELDKEITERRLSEFEIIKKEIAKKREDWLKELDDSQKKLNAEKTELERLKGAVSAQQSQIEISKSELENMERIYEKKEERLEQQWQKKYANLDNDLEKLHEEERKTHESERKDFKEQNDKLRESILEKERLIRDFKQLEQELGGISPAEYFHEINNKKSEINRLQEELYIKPKEEMRKQKESHEIELNNQKKLIDELNGRITECNADVTEAAELRLKNSLLKAENESLVQKAAIIDDVISEAKKAREYLQEQLDRYIKKPDPVNIKDREKEIEEPRFGFGKAIKPAEVEGEIDEIEWLEKIGEKCDEYGLHFNKRILYAFHTALKTSELSPLTILAGVSGTGKSQLPHLYSYFGGIYYESLSVQPNWDSKEFMLGFFNSIDNTFQAEPVLHFLAQSQQEWVEKNEEKGIEGYPGLRDSVCMVLLDEMNLAHPELYFAEFLSKLEDRRGLKKEVPSLLVKTGARLPDYKLQLGRNVLWAGTMNQDETTKSLSDKVLDRSIIIHFPRPVELKRRLKLKPLDETNRGKALHKTSWRRWHETETNKSFPGDDVKPYKEFIEKMNEYLSVAGRAIGHRVWQSVEYYMANYPEVRAAKKEGETDKTKLNAAMHTAFEDQLVQKVMPKLRGIDTRGKSRTECLDKILGLINIGIDGKPFNLTEDFNIACELGYGQFMWQTANYIKDEPTADNSDKETNK